MTVLLYNSVNTIRECTIIKMITVVARLNKPYKCCIYKLLTATNKTEIKSHDKKSIYLI